MRWAAQAESAGRAAACWAAAVAILGGCAERAPSEEGTARALERQTLSNLTVLPEFTLDAPVYGPAPARQYGPDLVTDGSQFFAAWWDDALQVVGTRIGSDGAVLDPAGVHLAFGGGAGLAFNGQHNLLAWRWGAGSDATLSAQRFSKAGQALDPAPKVVLSIPFLASCLVASNGQDFLLVWGENGFGSPDPRLRAARVAADGTALDTVALALSDSPDLLSSGLFDVAWNGSSYVVAWTERDDVIARRIGANGVLLDATPIAVSTGPSWQRGPDVERVGPHTWIAWSDRRDRDDIYVARMDQSGVVLDPDGVRLTAASAYASAPHLIATGDSAVIAWHEDATGGAYGDFKSAHLDPALHPTSGPYSIAETGGPLRGMFDGTQILIGWTTPDADIFGRRLKASGEPLDSAPFPIATTANVQRGGSAAWGGASYLVAWNDSRPASGVYGTLVNDSGQVARTEAIAISNAISTPRVAGIGQQFAVSWLELVTNPQTQVTSQHFRAARVDPQGTKLDVVPLEVAVAAFLPLRWTVTGGDQSYLFVYIDQSGDPNGNLRFVRLSREGTVLDVVPVALGTTSRSPAVAWNGQEFFVAWQTSSSLLASWIKPDGTVRPANNLSVTLNYHELVEVAWSGSSYLLLFYDFESGGVPAVLAVDGAGRAQGPIRRIEGQLGGNPSSRETLAWDGTSFLVAWSAYTGSHDPVLNFVRFGPDGDRVDSTPTVAPLEDFLEEGELLALASAHQGKSLLAYPRHDDAANVQAVRLRARQIANLLPPHDAGADRDTVDGSPPADAATDGVTTDVVGDTMTSDGATTDVITDTIDVDTTDVDTSDAATDVVTTDAATDVVTSDVLTDVITTDVIITDGSASDGGTRSPDGGTDKVVVSPADDGGCDCRLTSPRPSRLPELLAAAAAMLACARRRRQS